MKPQLLQLRSKAAVQSRDVEKLSCDKKRKTPEGHVPKGDLLLLTGCRFDDPGTLEKKLRISAGNTSSRIKNLNPLTPRRDHASTPAPPVVAPPPTPPRPATPRPELVLGPPPAPAPVPAGSAPGPNPGSPRFPFPHRQHCRRDNFNLYADCPSRCAATAAPLGNCLRVSLSPGFKPIQTGASREKSRDWRRRHGFCVKLRDFARAMSSSTLGKNAEPQTDARRATCLFCDTGSGLGMPSGCGPILKRWVLGAELKTSHVATRVVGPA